MTMKVKLTTLDSWLLCHTLQGWSTMSEIHAAVWLVARLSQKNLRHHLNSGRHLQVSATNYGE
jgi:hypothetical protein